MGDIVVYTVCGYQWAGLFYDFYMCNEETWSNAKIQSGMCPRQVKAMNNLLIRGVVRHNVRRSLVVYGCQATDVYSYMNNFTMTLNGAKYWFYNIFLGPVPQNVKLLWQTSFI